MREKQFLVKGVEVLRTGKHTDSAGRTSEVNVQLLNELADTYSQDVHLAPVVLGHSTYGDDSQPANGLIKNAYVNSESLLMDLVLPESTMSAIENGKYLHRSIGYYEPGSDFSPVRGKAYIQHLALLGRTPPAIKGLKPIVRLHGEQIKVYSEMTTKTFAEAIEMDEEMQASTPIEQDDSQQVLEDNAGEWLRLLLTEGSKGFKGEIVAFEPEPSSENQWLYDTEAQAFKGAFIDEDDLVYDFDITKSDDTWTRSYKQRQDASLELESEQQETDVAEVEMALPVEEVADIMPQEEYNEMAEMRKQMAEMQKELAEHRKRNYSQAAEKLFAEGKLTEGIVTKAELEMLFAELDEQTRGSEIVAFSEARKSTTLEFVQGLLDRLPTLVTFGEMAKPGYDKKGLVKDAEPIKPIYSESDPEAERKYAEIVAYCESKGYDVKKRGMFEKAMREMAR